MAAREFAIPDDVRQAQARLRLEPGDASLTHVQLRRDLSAQACYIDDLEAQLREQGHQPLLKTVCAFADPSTPMHEVFAVAKALHEAGLDTFAAITKDSFGNPVLTLSIVGEVAS
jgi:hypothetical protein